MEGDEKIWEEKGNARLIVTRWLVHTELEGNIGQLGFACDLPFGFLETSKSEIFTNVSFFSLVGRDACWIWRGGGGGGIEERVGWLAQGSLSVF